MLDSTRRTTKLDEAYTPRGITTPPEYFEAPGVIEKMLYITWGFLNSLPTDLRARAEHSMDDPRRVDFDAIPKPDRAGVPLTVLHGHQRTLAQSLIASGLSMRGYTQALQIMALENVLREIDATNRLRIGVAAGGFRDPDDYRIAFFGRPGFEDTWTWQVLGHHFMASYTIIRQRYIAVTPNVMGAEPASVGVMNPLGREEDLAFEILEQMPGDLRDAALIHDVAPADLVTRWVPRIGTVEYPDYTDLGIPSYEISDHDRERLKVERDAPAGVSLERMPPAGRDLLHQLIDWYFDRFPQEIAENLRRRFSEEAPDNVFFCWAGAERRGAPHYYRVQTSNFVVEFVNSIDSGNHIHGALRDLDYDFGHDLLAHHYAQEQATGHNLSRRLISSEARAGHGHQISGQPSAEGVEVNGASPTERLS